MKRCFVIGPIGDKMAPVGSPGRVVYEEALRVYEDVIRPACAANDLELVRADGIAVPGEITDQIFRHLYEDEVVVADVSGGNPNVMYELGLRHTRDLLTVQIGEYGQLPFDVQTLRTIMFSRSERGLIDARNDLERVLRVGLAEGSDPLPATRLWLARSSGTLVPPPPSTDEADAPENGGEAEPADDRGFVERMVDLEEQFPALNDAVENIVAVLERLGTEAEEMAAQIETVSSSGAPAAKRLTIITQYAQSLSEPADLLTQHTGNFASGMKDLDGSVRGILSEMLEEESYLSEDADEFTESIIGLAQGTREGMEGLNEFGTVVGSLGRVSKALRRPGQQMGDAIRTMAKAAALVDEWEALALALRSRGLAPQESPSASEAPPDGDVAVTGAP